MTGIHLQARLSFPFLVVRKGRSILPRFRHATIEEASTEAERRATQCRGETYLVLQEVLRVQSTSSAQAPRAEEPGGNAPRSPGSHRGGRHDER